MSRDDSAALLQLYRQAAAQPRAAFVACGLQWLRRQVRHQSAILGQGYLQTDQAGHRPGVPLVPLELHSVAVDPAGVAEWRHLNHADRAIPIVLSAPGRAHAFHAPTLFAAAQDAPMRDYARRFGRQSYLITALTAPHSTVVAWCSLYRPDPDDLFDDGERGCTQQALAHLQQALRINTLLEGRAADRPPFAGAEGSAGGEALITRHGQIVQADRDFQARCASEWTQFDGRGLPVAVAAELAERGSVRLTRLRMAVRPLGPYLLARAVHAPRASPLPPRRMGIARLFAQGMASKEIARRLGIAPATVRTQLQTAYRQLGIGTRAELRTALQRIEAE